jgi:phosphoglycolate phosphatase-like HAD superfamily hydrolase
MIERRWDEYDVYLFDVDGTLLHCKDAVHYFAFCHVLTHIAGRPLNLDNVKAHGNVDMGILRDALALAGIPDQQWRSRVNELCTALGDFVYLRKDQLSVNVLPGVIPLLRYLRARKAVLGITTGNFRVVGEIKLQACRLDSYFDFFAFSDGCEYRHQVVGHAIAEARKRSGRSSAICLIGDTPDDVLAARHHGLGSIAVASGIYSQDDLQQAKPDWLVSSLQQLLSQDSSGSSPDMTL